MKRIIFILLMTMVVSSLFAQSGKETYIVFTSLQDIKWDRFYPSKTGIIRKAHTTRQGETYYTYYLINKEFQVSYGMDMYSFDNSPTSLSALPPITRPKSFLNTINYIDWDIEGPKLTKPEAEALYKKLSECDRVYFIDRRDFKTNSIVIVRTSILDTHTISR